MTTETARTYSICGWVGGKDRRVTLGAILDEYARLGREIPVFLASFIREGIRYSFEEFDTLSAAMGELYKLDSHVWERIGEDSDARIARALAKAVRAEVGK